MNLSWRGGEYSQDDAAKTSPQFSNEAIKLLKKGVPEVLESAMSLIRLFSMLDCDSINETMIKRMYYPDVDNLMDTWEPVFVPRVATHCEGMRFLQKHNIVFAVKDDSIHVNQKVATAVRAQMIKEGIFTKWFETSYKLVAASFPQTGFATLGMLYRFPRKEAGDKVVRHVFCLNKHYLKHFALKPQSQELGVSLEPLRHVKIARTLYESGQSVYLPCYMPLMLTFPMCRCMVELSRPFEAKFILDEAEKILGGVMGLPNIEETSRQAAKNLRLYISTSRMWLALLLNTEILLEPPEQYPLHMIVAKHNSGMRELQMKNYNEAYVLFSELREFLNPGFHQTWICTLKYHMALVRLRQLENEIAKATSNFEEARNYFEEADSLLDELVTLEKASNSIISDSSMWYGVAPTIIAKKKLTLPGSGNFFMPKVTSIALLILFLKSAPQRPRRRSSTYTMLQRPTSYSTQGLTIT